jgi:hypothetical protein
MIQNSPPISYDPWAIYIYTYISHTIHTNYTQTIHTNYIHTYSPGDSVTPASKDPIITQLAPMARALRAAPVEVIPPSAITGTSYLRKREREGEYIIIIIIIDFDEHLKRYGKWSGGGEVKQIKIKTAIFTYDRISVLSIFCHAKAQKLTFWQVSRN